MYLLFSPFLARVVRDAHDDSITAAMATNAVGEELYIKRLDRGTTESSLITSKSIEELAQADSETLREIAESCDIVVKDGSSLLHAVLRQKLYSLHVEYYDENRCSGCGRAAEVLQRCFGCNYHHYHRDCESNSRCHHSIYCREIRRRGEAEKRDVIRRGLRYDRLRTIIQSGSQPASVQEFVDLLPMHYPLRAARLLADENGLPRNISKVYGSENFLWLAHFILGKASNMNHRDIWLESLLTFVDPGWSSDGGVDKELHPNATVLLACPEIIHQLFQFLYPHPSNL